MTIVMFSNNKMLFSLTHHHQQNFPLDELNHQVSNTALCDGGCPKAVL